MSVRTLRERALRLPAQAVDGLLALALLVELECEAWLDTAVSPSHRLPAAIAAVFLVAPVIIRRRWPVAALLAGFAAAAALSTPPADNILNEMTGPVLPSLLLAFTVGARVEPRRGIAAVSLGIALLLAGNVWTELAGEPDGLKLAQELLSSIVLPGAFWTFGWLWRERSGRAAAFGELLELVHHERERHRHAAVTQERIRIGRELQDIIAQNVSAIIIQAGGARQLIDTDPERAREAIRTVERTGSEALADLRRTLGLLRSDEDPRQLAPQPGLAQLDALLDSARERGLTCTFSRDGDPSELATGVDLVGYRVVEAALELAASAGGGSAQITVSYGNATVEIDVSAVGTVSSAPAGWRALSHRVALYDGTLRLASPTAESFEIHTRLPLAAAGR